MPPSTRTAASAEISVRFVGEQTYVVRNKAGEIVEGNPREIKRQRTSGPSPAAWGPTTRTGSLSPPATDRLGMRAPFRILAVVAALMAATPLPAQILDFEALDGWRDDDHAEALVSFLNTCDLIDAPDWRPICAMAADVPQDDISARSFFELFFKPVVVGEPPALFTGYFEPELEGSPTRSGRFQYPIYRRPPELRDGTVFHSRAAIDNGALAGRGLEIAWLDDPVDVYFLQIQGSGRIRMTDGTVVRLGYAGANGHAYRSIGQEMVRRGTHSMDQVSAQEIAVLRPPQPRPGA